MCLGNRWNLQLRFHGQAGVERVAGVKNDRKCLEGDFSYESNLPLRSPEPRSQDKHPLLGYTKRGSEGVDSAAGNFEAHLSKASNSGSESRTNRKWVMTEDTRPTKSVAITPKSQNQHRSLDYTERVVEGTSTAAEDLEASNQALSLKANNSYPGSETGKFRKWIMAEDTLPSSMVMTLGDDPENGEHENKIESQASVVSSSSIQSNHKEDGKLTKSSHNAEQSSKRGNLDGENPRGMSKHLRVDKTRSVSSEDPLQVRVSISSTDTPSQSKEMDSLSEGLLQDTQSNTPENQPELKEMNNLEPWLMTLDNVLNTKDWGIAQQVSPIAEVAPKPIHITGLNKYGNFFAQSLANSGTPVTFLMSRPLAIQDWHDAGETIRLLRNGEIQSTSGISTEPAVEDSSQRQYSETIENPDTVIEHLIVASHPGMMLASVRRVAHRLRPYSTVCFCENGLGIIDLVNKHVFPNPNQRPHYILANLDHDLREGRGRFDIVEARTGTLSCTKLPKLITGRFGEDPFTIQRKYFDWPASSKYLIGALLQAPDLNTRTLGHKSFHRQQLMSVAMHTLIDSVSVAFDVKCEDLLFNYSISQYMQKVLEEISRIICALPEIDTIPQAKKDFSVKQMQVQVKRILFNVGDKHTDFLLAVREGKRRTGMNFYSGYLLDRAKELKLMCPVLEALMLQVEGKQQYYSRKARSYIPFDFSAIRRVPSGQKADDGKV